MNQATVTKYSDMRQIATNVGQTMTELNAKCKYINLQEIASRTSR